jgi:hypothetical protein
VAKHLRSELEETTAIFSLDASSTPKLLFLGADKTLTYVATSNGAREVGGLYQVNLVRDAEGTLKSSRRLIQAKISARVNDVVLLRGVQTLRFKYFGSTAPEAPAMEWNSNNQLPIAIQIEITFAPNDKRHWPKTLVRLQTAE